MNERDPMHDLQALTAAELQRTADTRRSSVPDLEEFVARLQRPNAWHRLKRRLLGVGVVLGVLGAGSVAWAVLHHSESDDPTTVACYRTADLDGSRIGLQRVGLAPVEACSAAWSALASWGAVPELVACVADAGVAAVFPGDDRVCAQLGLPVLLPPAGNESRDLDEFQSRIVERQLESGCLQPADLVEIIDDAIQEYGLDGWSAAVIGEYGATTPCAAVEFDVAGQVVIVSPLADIFLPTSGG